MDQNDLYYIPGSWNVICDSCGKKIKASEAKQRWDGLIVCPEDFETFEDQLNYFAEAKIIASISGSGLHNSMWMQPGQTVIEISSLIDGIERYPILVEFFKEDIQKKDIFYLQKSLHPFWAGIAFYCEHLYISIPNHYGKIEKVKEYIEKRPQLKKILMD